MTKKFLILDLDNTIYPVSSIGHELFKPLFQLIEKNGEFSGEIESIKKAIMRKPFQKVAEEYSFSEKLLKDGLKMLKNTICSMKMSTFEDYEEIRKMPVEKILVTTGFTKMQRSKVKQLNIKKDFKEIHIVDPQISQKTKRDVFRDILERLDLKTEDILVIGDDPNSEIKAANELGIDTILYDKLNFNPKSQNIRITNFKELQKILSDGYK
ncbi:HAD family hydrolase [Yeosuana marina]|uniref:HAD family hydrolase n=1 Tax=Yeosuana marina TaxID=1565536 RepID=UPI001422588C|nr:HAD family hydrolase [Yeosuana marina]